MIIRHLKLEAHLSCITHMVSYALFGFKQVCRFREKPFIHIRIVKQSCQFGFLIHTKATKTVEDQPMITHVQFGFNQFPTFSGEIYVFIFPKVPMLKRCPAVW